VARSWLSIRVELIEGGGRTLWPRPGRLFAAARSHTFAALADAIDTAFARWDRSHLCLFELADGTDVCGPIRVVATNRVRAGRDPTSTAATK